MIGNFNQNSYFQEMNNLKQKVLIDDFNTFYSNISLFDELKLSKENLFSLTNNNVNIRFFIFINLININVLN